MAEAACLLLLSALRFDYAVSTDSSAVATLGTASDQDGSDAEPATGHTAAAIPRTSPDTSSELR